MPLRRSLRPLAAAFAFLAFSPVIVAAPDTKPTKWDPVRITAPDSVEELKALQDRVKTVVETATPATVGIWILNSEGDREGAGSGVIVSEDGLVLTAAHVIAPPGIGPRRRDSSAPERERKVELELYDGSRVMAKVLGRDREADSGMVKITDPIPKGAKWPGANDGHWPFVEVGESTDVKPGQWVVTLGHPGGPKPDRRAPLRVGQIIKNYSKERVLKSDCALVGGDSGGPLFDLTGKLIGIHSRIGVSMSDNIHIPTKVFKQNWDDLASGKIFRPRAYIGVILNRRDDAEPTVVEVVDDSPAKEAGLKAGDLILKIGGKAVKTSDEVDKIVQSSRVGENVKVEVRRGDDTKTLSVTLGRLTESVLENK
jgi:serine protease Do